MSASSPGQGPRLGRYEVLGVLARGGMAEVLIARHAGVGGFEKIVVLKRILPQFADDQDFNKMFLEEARVAANLDHQNCIRITDVGEADGSYFFAMEYIHGEDLRKVLRECVRQRIRPPLEVVVSMMVDACRGLHHAHEAKAVNGTPLRIVHRDVSPANILVGYDGRLKIVDFGIARATREVTMTQAGQIKGKVAYMSPEQCKGKPLDRRSDVFALGIVAWELCTLRRLFRGEGGDHVSINLICNEPIPTPSDKVGEFPPALESIIMTALARDPEQRFQTAKAMAKALEKFARDADMDVSQERRAAFVEEVLGMRALPWEDASQLEPFVRGGPGVPAGADPSASGLLSEGRSVPDFPVHSPQTAVDLGDGAPIRGGAGLWAGVAVGVLLVVGGVGGYVYATRPNTEETAPAAAAVAEPIEASAAAEEPAEIEEPAPPEPEPFVEPDTDTDTDADAEGTQAEDAEPTVAVAEGVPEDATPAPKPAKKRRPKSKSPTNGAKATNDQNRDADAFMPH